jgi:alpha-glucoside transport system substrate-binding protein
LIVPLVLALSLVLACGGDDDDEAPASGVPASPAGQVSGTTAAAGGQAGTQQRIGGTVTVMAEWGGNEQETFMAMVKPFEDRTGVRIQYEGTRDLNAILTTRVQGGNPPDVAGLPGPGQMAEFARQGKLIDLTAVLDSSVKDQYSEDWLKLGQVDGKQVGIFIKVALKGPIWYNAREFPKVSGGKTPQTWDELMSLSRQIADSGTAPWCLSLESSATSGWPGTDWIEDIVLRQAGPETYDKWYQGQVKWTSPEIKKAWQTWGEIVANDKMVFGGKQTMLTLNFGEGGNAMFASPPRCYMHHQASFITDFFTKAYPNLKPVEGFNFFPFPTIDQKYAGAHEVAGDLFGMFKDTPQARALMQYLTTPEAQEIWVKRGGAISPNKKVALSSYPDEIARKMAETLTTAKTVRFDASDLMPEAMNNAFFKAVLDYVQNPGNLDSILSGLDRVQTDAYKR